MMQKLIKIKESQGSLDSLNPPFQYRAEAEKEIRDQLRRSRYGTSFEHEPRKKSANKKSVTEAEKLNKLLIDRENVRLQYSIGKVMATP